MDILIVDDELDICEILSSLLKEKSYNVDYALDANSAFHKITSLHPPLVICDITMPGKNGIQLLEELKARGSVCGIVMLTAHAESSMVIQALQLGAIDYVVKPFDSDALLSKIDGWLELGRRLNELSESQTDDSSSARKKFRMIELFRLKNKKNSDQAA